MPRDNPQVGEIYEVYSVFGDNAAEACPGIVADVSRDRVTLINPSNGVRAALAPRTLSTFTYKGNHVNLVANQPCYIQGCTQTSSLWFYRLGTEPCATCYQHAPVGTCFEEKAFPQTTLTNTNTKPIPASSCPKCGCTNISEDFWVKSPHVQWWCRTCNEGWYGTTSLGRIYAHGWAEQVNTYLSVPQIKARSLNTYLSASSVRRYLRTVSPWDLLGSVWENVDQTSPRQVIHIQTPLVPVAGEWLKKPHFDFPAEYMLTVSVASVSLGNTKEIIPASADSFLLKSRAHPITRDTTIPLTIWDEFMVPDYPNDPALKVIGISPHRDGFLTVERNFWVFYSTKAITLGCIRPLVRKSHWARLLEEDLL